MKRGDEQYPDGAMLGKVAFATEEDPSFPNSLQPFLLTRVQFMRKTASDYSATDGWGYVLYVPTAPAANPEIDDVRDPRVCHGCHTLVKHRDYVFSRPAFLGAASTVADRSNDLRGRFQPRETSGLSTFEKTLLRAVGGGTKVRRLAMPLFVGALDESLSPLQSYAAADQSPYLLVDEKRRLFLFARPLPPSPNCAKSAELIFPFSSENGQTMWRHDRFCDGVRKSQSVTPVPSALKDPK
jgi:hypothetical protein